MLDFNERIGLDILSLSHWRDAARSVKCLNHCVSRDPVSDDHTTVVWSDGLGHEAGAPRRLAAIGTRSQNKLSLTAEENLHGNFLDPFQLNSVETEVIAAKLPWQAGITEANGRAFELVLGKMLDSTQSKDKREYEERIDATVSAGNVLLRTRGFSQHQHVFAILSWLLMS